MADSDSLPGATPVFTRAARLPGALLLAAVALTAAKLLFYRALAQAPLGVAMCQWDCGWYMSIVTRGYDVAPHLEQGFHQANWAFFPLYPMLARGVDALAGIGPQAVGLYLSTLFFIAFALLGARYRAATRACASAWTWLLLLIAWPYSFYFHTLLTEAPFAALITAALLALEFSRPLTAGVLSALITATRPTGIALAAAIGVRQLWTLRRARGRRAIVIVLVPAAISVVGLLAFMAFMFVHTGDGLAFVTIQRAWGHHASNPLRVLGDAFAVLGQTPLSLRDPYHASWAVAGLLASFWLLWRRRVTEAWLCATPVLMALGGGMVVSMPRYVAASPIFLFVAADLLDRVRGTWMRAGLLAGMAGLQVVLVLEWFEGARTLS